MKNLYDLDVSRIQYGIKSTMPLLLEILDILYEQDDVEFPEMPKDELKEKIILRGINKTPKVLDGMIKQLEKRYFEKDKEKKGIIGTPLSYTLFKLKYNKKVFNEVLYLGFRRYQVVQLIEAVINKKITKTISAELTKDEIEEYIRGLGKLELPKNYEGDIAPILNDFVFMDFFDRKNKSTIIIRRRVPTTIGALLATFYTPYHLRFPKDPLKASDHSFDLAAKALFTTKKDIVERLIGLARKGLIIYEEQASLNQFLLPQNEKELIAVIKEWGRSY